MPPSLPTCAARVIRNDWLDYGWGTALSPEANRTVWRIREESNAMNRLQISRDRPVDAASIRAALFWEHRHMVQQRIVSTPAADYLSLFAREREVFKDSLNGIRRKFSEGFENVTIHPLFEGMRGRKFTLWPVRIDDTWVTIILQIESGPVTAQIPHVYFDREVTKIAIIDPFPEGRRSRQSLIERRLREFLLEGCINFSATALTESFETRDVLSEWETGYVAYAISREFLRRLKVLIHRSQLVPNVSTDFLWGPFEEHYSIDAYRESLLAACAHQTIEKSGYLVRLALEVPSSKSKHNPDSLSHIKADSVILAPEEVPDELYTSFKAPTCAVVVIIPEDKRALEQSEIAARKRGQESDFEESEYDSSDFDEPVPWNIERKCPEEISEDYLSNKSDSGNVTREERALESPSRSEPVWKNGIDREPSQWPGVVTEEAAVPERSPERVTSEQGDDSECLRAPEPIDVEETIAEPVQQCPSQHSNEPSSLPASVPSSPAYSPMPVAECAPVYDADKNVSVEQRRDIDMFDNGGRTPETQMPEMDLPDSPPPLVIEADPIQPAIIPGLGTVLPTREPAELCTPVEDIHDDFNSSERQLDTDGSLFGDTNSPITPGAEQIQSAVPTPGLPSSPSTLRSRQPTVEEVVDEEFIGRVTPQKRHLDDGEDEEPPAKRQKTDEE
ncbi:hypothetical protein AAE478_008995 [Parahypoxylon ruwenzoriense]